MNNTDNLIDQLAGTLEPVRPLSLTAGRALFGVCATASVITAVLLLGVRADLAAFTPNPVLLISAGLFFLFGIACGVTLTRMARPAVGAMSNGWRWALAAMLLLPAVAVVEASLFPAFRAGTSVTEGIGCLARGVGVGSATAALLTFWLSRGAPVRVELASWLVGFAAGSVGAVAVALTCPDASVGHAGIWHSAIILVSGGLTRVLLPRYLRW